MTAETKLELTWIGKDNRPRLEPRILIEDEHHSYHASARREADIFDNVLIRGDNLLALRALEQDYAGRIRCAFIDPPYNTGSAFEHYDDGLEHSVWLSLMRDRLEIIRRLLTEDGSFWATLDDHEAHYFKVMCDEVFGRSNFITSIVWEKTTSARNDAEFFSSGHDHIFVYARDRSKLRLNRMPRTEAAEKAYSNPDNDPRGPWREGDYKCAKSADERPNLFYAITHPSTGAEVWPRRERVWAYGRAEHDRHVRENLLWWGKTGNYRLPKLKRFRSEAPSELVARTLWQASEVDQTRTARQESKKLFSDRPFATPKPERLLHRIIHLATDRDDIVLDSFAGSGTTGAVAHKMRRRWIMAELGEHCESHVVPRLQKVIDGEDKGGVTKETGWNGGGGFRYYRLAPSLLEKDQFGNWIISKSYNAEMLSEAMCKHFGFRYAPSDEHYWMHGSSSETDFIYVTTASLTHDQLRAISQEVGHERTLLIACKAFQTPQPEGFGNLTLRKIPAAVLNRCEWGKDDYSLKIENLPMMDDTDEEDQSDLFIGETAK